MGGIQKSLLNLLKATHDQYKYTLLLFSKSGALLTEIPSDVKVISTRRVYRMLGLSREELKRYPILFITKYVLMKITKYSTRRFTVGLLGIGQRPIKGFDAVISYSHLTGSHSFSGGCGDFALDKTICQNKICCIHCDYLNSGLRSKSNDNEYLEFTKIACCSESVKNRFSMSLVSIDEKTFVLRNFYDFSIVESGKEKIDELLDTSYINLVCIARLSKEKGIDQILYAMHQAHRKDMRLYIVGDGPYKNELRKIIAATELSQQVFFMGEKTNPYNYVCSADYLILMSYHEAAPMVYDEAHILNTHIISSETTSTSEMLDDDDFICKTLDELSDCLLRLEKKELSQHSPMDNVMQTRQLEMLLE